MSSRTLRVGLTGGIASGKSTAAGFFAEHGVTVIDADRIAREVVEPGCRALAAIVERFGDQVLLESGHLDRAALRAAVFTDPHSRRDLEEILHPRILAEMRSRADRADGPYQILVIPLLIEAGLQSEVDRVLVIDCSEVYQAERLRQRDAETSLRIRQILEAQASRQERLEWADEVIGNNGDLAQLEAEVERVHRFYLVLAKSLPPA